MINIRELASVVVSGCVIIAVFVAMGFLWFALTPVADDGFDLFLDPTPTPVQETPQATNDVEGWHPALDPISVL